MRHLIEDNSIPEPNTGCWLWLGHTDRNGYGTRRISSQKTSKNWFAHRLSYKIYKGDFHEGLHILHSCDNPCCVNPAHLFAGNHLDNMRDMARKNRNKVPHPNIQGEKHFNSVLTEYQVKEIKNQYKPRIITQPYLAHKYGVSISLIRKIVQGRMWKHV